MFKGKDRAYFDMQHTPENQIKRFNALPDEVKKEVVKTLGVYNSTEVVYEYGKFEVSPHCMMSATYAQDRKHYGSFAFEALKSIEQVKQARDDYNARLNG